MEFLASIISSVIKMLIIAATAFGGWMLGKFLRKKKDEKKK